MLNRILLEEAQLLLAKGAFCVMPFLIADVVDDSSELGVAIGECAKTFLPGETPGHPMFCVDEIGGCVLHVAHEVGERDRGF